MGSPPRLRSQPIAIYKEGERGDATPAAERMCVPSICYEYLQLNASNFKTLLQKFRHIICISLSSHSSFPTCTTQGHRSTTLHRRAHGRSVTWHPHSPRWILPSPPTTPAAATLSQKMRYRKHSCLRTEGHWHFPCIAPSFFQRNVGRISHLFSERANERSWDVFWKWNIFLTITKSTTSTAKSGWMISAFGFKPTQGGLCFSVIHKINDTHSPIVMMYWKLWGKPWWKSKSTRLPLIGDLGRSSQRRNRVQSCRATAMTRRMANLILLEWCNFYLPFPTVQCSALMSPAQRHDLNTLTFHWNLSQHHPATLWNSQLLGFQVTLDLSCTIK